MNCLEFGSGSSSIWISKRVKQLTSIEHNLDWYNKIKNSSKNLKNFELLCLNDESYYNYIETIVDDSISFCLVDGLFRDIISLKIINKIRPGGFILIDDIERYLPSNDTHSPSKNCYYNDNWKLFEGLTKNWHKLYFSDGITDQIILTRPI
jgi:SAM-dependent methyltransferase